MDQLPSKEELEHMSPTQYAHVIHRFRSFCVECGRIGQAVSESIEGKGFYYCEDTMACKAARRSATS